MPSRAHELPQNEDTFLLALQPLYPLMPHQARCLPRHRNVVHATLASRVAQAANLVHRDLRLDNILWQADTQPFLADFELAAKQDLEVRLH